MPIAELAEVEITPQGTGRKSRKLHRKHKDRKKEQKLKLLPSCSSHIAMTQHRMQIIFGS